MKGVTKHMEHSKYWDKNFAETTEEDEQVVLCYNCMSKFSIDIRGCKTMYIPKYDEHCYQYFCPYCGTKHTNVL